MSPDSDSRIARLEQEQARHGERIASLDATVRALASLPVQLATMNAATQSLEEDVREIKKMLSDRDDQASKDRKELRVALLGLIGVIIAALIAGVFAYLAAGAGP